MLACPKDVLSPCSGYMVNLGSPRCQLEPEPYVVKGQENYLIMYLLYFIIHNLLNSIPKTFPQSIYTTQTEIQRCQSSSVFHQSSARSHALGVSVALRAHTPHPLQNPRAVKAAAGRGISLEESSTAQEARPLHRPSVPLRTQRILWQARG